MRKICSGFAMLMALVLMRATPVLAFQVAAMTFEEMADEATRIFVGVCTGKQNKTMSLSDKGDIPKLAYTEYTFDAYLSGLLPMR